MRVAAVTTSLLPVPGAPATMVGEIAGEMRYPAGRCMAVALHVTNATTGEPLRLRPYLGAAAHVYVAPADVSNAALRAQSVRHEKTVMATANTARATAQAHWPSRSCSTRRRTRS